MLQIDNESDLDWDAIQRTVLQHLGDRDFMEDIQRIERESIPSILDIVEKHWVQRVGVKTKKCSVEEHPEGLAVSSIEAQNLLQQFLYTKKWLQT
jgi:hypothetical protein